VRLPRGGIVAHPPGSGKTRIVSTFMAEARLGVEGDGSGSSSPSSGPPLLRRSVGAMQTLLPDKAATTLIICPAHLCGQWLAELALAGATDAATVVNYEAVGGAATSGLRWVRVVIDEPQDCPVGEPWDALQELTGNLRVAGAAVWLLCGTAQSHLETLGRLLLGRVGWHVARLQSEWRGCPQFSHIVRSRFLMDPPWACLPMPSLKMVEVPVVLRPQESADAAVASLAGFVLDGVLLLSFGARAAFIAAQERDQLLLQMGWSSFVGTSHLPTTEHALADWEGTVAQRSQQKLEELQVQIASLEAEEGRFVGRFQVEVGDAALAPDLSFMAQEVVRVQVDGLEGGPVLEDAWCFHRSPSFRRWRSVGKGTHCFVVGARRR